MMRPSVCQFRNCRCARLALQPHAFANSVAEVLTLPRSVSPIQCLIGGERMQPDDLDGGFSLCFF
jgi:hypothetical protein